MAQTRDRVSSGGGYSRWDDEERVKVTVFTKDQRQTTGGRAVAVEDKD